MSKRKTFFFGLLRKAPHLLGDCSGEAFSESSRGIVEAIKDLLEKNMKGTKTELAVAAVGMAGRWIWMGLGMPLAP